MTNARSAAAVLLALAASPASAQQNVANNPLTDIPAIQVQNYLQPVMSGQPGSGAVMEIRLPRL